MHADTPIQLSLIPAHLDAAREERDLIGLWLGGERFLRSHGRLISAFVFFHFQDGGEAIISIRADDQRVPRRVYGRWWVEGTELVVTLGEGDIRADFSVRDGVLYWADEVLVRRDVSTLRRPAPPKPLPSTAREQPASTLALGD